MTIKWRRVKPGWYQFDALDGQVYAYLFASKHQGLGLWGWMVLWAETKCGARHRECGVRWGMKAARNAADQKLAQVIAEIETTPKGGDSDD